MNKAIDYGLRGIFTIFLVFALLVIGSNDSVQAAKKTLPIKSPDGKTSVTIDEEKLKTFMVQGTTQGVPGRNGLLEINSGQPGVAIRDNVVGERFRIDGSNGNINGTHGSYHVSSDVRLKHNISTIPNALATVKQLRGVNFYWKGDSSNLRTGLISQEVEKVFPQSVYTDESTEEKMKALEHKFLYSFLKDEEPKQIESVEKEVHIEIPENLDISDIASLTYTQQAILKALYELQVQLDSPISFKSLAKYLYPGKRYGSVRTTLSEYLDTLSTYNLVKKDKIGRETVANITSKGKKLAKELVKKKKQRTNNYSPVITIERFIRYIFY